MSKLVIVLVVACSLIIAVGCTSDQSKPIAANDVAAAEKIANIEFTSTERDSMLDELNNAREQYRALHKQSIANAVIPALQFNPLPLGFEPPQDQKRVKFDLPKNVPLPEKDGDLAFYSLAQLASLMKDRKITSMQLTRLALDRLKRYDSLLHCVITLTEDSALAQAARADREIAEGNWRGPLHGIPYGAKDLLAKSGYPTTWGAMPYKDQSFDYDATVVRKLDEAGAVLVAKLSLGALAWGDVWFADTTRNPWNLEQGSSGSSAGSASAVAAGLVPFAIGSETWGSIVSPSTRCGATGLRPTYGRVSRYGAMALSWSMDKLGPICRSVEDCAMVFDAIRGPDGLDPTVIEAAFNPIKSVDLSTLRIGYLKTDFDSDTSYAPYNKAALDKMQALGADLIPIVLPELPVEPLQIILSAEAGAAFDELTRSGQDDLMVRQIKDAWPNVFRAARLIPAVEYIQANRMRTKVIAEMNDLMSGIDLYLAPSFEGNNLLLTNLTGHPCVVLPDGFDKDGSPVSICFIGRLFDEATLLAVADQYQQATDFNQKHPPLFTP